MNRKIIQVIVYLLNKKDLIEGKEHVLEEYEQVKLADEFHEAIRLCHLPDYCKAHALLSRVTSKFRGSILSWVQKEHTNMHLICIEK